MINPTVKETLCRYGFGVALTIAVTWLRVLLSEALGDRVPFGLHYVSVLLTAWLCGAGPAIVALLLGLVSAAYCVFQPNYSFEFHDAGDVLSLVLYFLVGVVGISLMRRAELQQSAARHKASECEAMAIQLGEADRRKDEFLALLAHELRNPLATLVAGIEAIDRNALNQVKQNELVGSMRRQLQQVVVIVNDVLDVSRYLRGGLALNREVVDLRDIVEGAIEIARPCIEQSDHLLRFNRPSEPAPVDADTVRLTQVVVNLLSNAAKYTPRNGRILVLMETYNDRVRLHVVDNGIGVPLEAQEAIFELFTQANPSATRDGQGLGIGLGLVKQLVELHGGTVGVTSQGPGRGSRFSIELTQVPVERLAVATKPDRRQSHSPSEAGRRRVLVIDDNADAANTLAALLRLDGHLVEVAYDGSTGVEASGALRPDVVLLDIGMPGMDGYETARQIRRSLASSPPRLIAVSGWGSDADRERSRDAGIDVHLTKPVQLDALADAMGGEASPVHA